MRWTDSQRAAIEHGDGLLAVVAGAGSGKTGVLTERFVHLVAERGVAPEHILTITFTRAATAEMKTRIIRKLEQRGLHDARTRIESAYIHTVHALCRRILQENPFEAGIDPEPSVLPAPAANHLKREAFHHALASLLRHERDFETDPLIDLIADYLNLDSVRGDPLQALYELVQRVADATRHQGYTADDLEGWKRAYPSAEALAWHYVREVLNFALTPRPASWSAEAELQRQAEATHSIAASWSAEAELQRQAEATHSIAASWSAEAELQRQAEATHSIAASWSAEAELQRQAEATLPHSIVSLATLDDLRAFVGQLREQNPNAARMLESLLATFDPALEQRARDIACALLELTVAYLREYEALKQTRGALDFDDMQIRALQLLRDSATVRRRYQRMFRYTLVDETQDIDGLQAQIIDLLSAGGNLMVVGDAQQSIYGFRYADPRVFEGWQQRACDNGGRLVPLQANFRSRPDILAFVEKVFRHHWGERFLVLQPTRPAVRPSDELPVQVWVMPQRDAATEARLVASQVHHWVSTGSLSVHDPETGELRPAQYGDFALLFHQFTKVGAFEQAFRAVGAPYYVVGGGRGYWTQYEVRDLTNLLRALSDPEDDLALAAVLRSPFVGLSIDALMTLALHAEPAELPLHLCLQADLELDPADRARLTAFLEWFEPLCQRVGEWSVGALLARALEASQYESRLLAQGEAGRQAVANVRKLLAMALEQPTVAPRDFAAQLELTSRLEQREGNAPTYEESANVVRFYTVHAAKGLEFSVVFVVDTAYNLRPREVGLEVDAHKGVVALQVVRPDVPTPYEPVPLKVLREQTDAREEAEGLRKLYVALTRARDYLIVVLTDAPQNVWCRALRGALAQQLDRRESTIPLPNGSIGVMKWVG
jgi:ATP-dependent helicase/nuclease subunit A